MTSYRTLMTGLACFAIVIIAAPDHARAAGATGWFGGRTIAGSGKSATQVRTLGDFQSVEVSGAISVKIRQSDRGTVEVRADDNLLALLETVVEPSSKGGTLHVRWKRGENIRSRSEAAVTVDVRSLESVATQGSGRVAIEPLNTPSLRLSIAGSGDIKLLALSAESLDVRVAGSGDVQGSGKAGRLKVGIAGSGDVLLPDLVANEVNVSIAGSGNATVHADKSLDVSIAGSGDVTFIGDAAVQSSVAGSGRVTRRK